MEITRRRKDFVSSPAKSAPKRTGSFSGEEGRKRFAMEQEREAQKREARKNQKNKPFRFFCPIGETREFAVLDDAPNFFAYEHSIRGLDGKFNVFTGCVKETDNCPVCEAVGKESYYAMYLTVLDFTEFKLKARDGRAEQIVPFSRKLLVVKPHQQKIFMRFYEKQKTLRGAIFETTRDGEKEASIGGLIQFQEFMTEEDLATYTRSWTDAEKKKQTEDCSVPYEYLDMFEEPDVETLRAIVGGKPVPGSRAHESEVLGSSRSRRAAPASKDADDWEDAGKNDKPWDDDDAPAEGGPVDPDEPAAEEEQPVARSRRAAPAKEEEAAPAESPRRPLRRTART